jgi:hypothetical protein
MPMRRESRHPPMLASRGYGYCRWCDGDIFYPPTHKHAGQRHARRLWHDECLTKYEIACGGFRMRAVVEARDRGVCADCRTVCGPVVLRWVRWPPSPRYWTPHRIARVKPFSVVDTTRCYMSQVQAIIGCGWHADHIIPLWNIPVDVSLDDRDKYWGLSNIQTLCYGCHKKKTCAEAKERALMRRLSMRAASGQLPIHCVE